MKIKKDGLSEQQIWLLQQAASDFPDELQEVMMILYDEERIIYDGDDLITINDSWRIAAEEELSRMISNALGAAASNHSTPTDVTADFWSIAADEELMLIFSTAFVDLTSNHSATGDASLSGLGGSF